MQYSVFTEINYYKITFNTLVIILLAIFLYRIIKANFISIEAVNLAFPFKNGKFYTVDAGNSKLINNHYSNEVQKYAVDFYKLNNFGFRANGIYPKNLNKYFIYEEALYSPIDGIVVKIEDETDDLIPPEMDLISRAGNHIVLKILDNKFLLMAHLKRGSFKVKEGDKVKAGDLLAKIGNTGRTEEPHLHIHCMQEMENDYVLKGKAIPIKFSGKFLVRNNIINS